MQCNDIIFKQLTLNYRDTRMTSNYDTQQIKMTSNKKGGL